MPTRTDPATFPNTTPLLKVTQADDADVHAGNLSQWDQRYDQLSPGKFSGTVTELWLSQSQIFVETANQTLRQSCAAWPKSIWFGIPTPGQGLMSWGGRELHADAVCIREGGAEFELLTKPNFNLFGIVVEREAFGSYLENVQKQSLDDLMRARDVLTLPQMLKQKICSRLSNILADASTALNLSEPNNAALLQNRIFESLSTLLSCADSNEHTTRRDSRQTYRHPALDTLRQSILDNPTEHHSVEALCERFHLSRRALQNYFEEATGLAPLAYMRALRLNAVRRALLENAGKRTVSELAYACGFNHLGKFSQHYQMLFGELPSQTKSKAH